MNTRMKKGIFWSTVITSMVLVMSFISNLLGGNVTFAAGFHEHGHGPDGGMRAQGGFGHEGFHHGTGFSWMGFLLFLIIGIAVLVLLVKWLKKKSKTSSMQQFIDTSLMTSPKASINHNHASILDQWEKNITTKKENK
ncbi:magnesium transporter CorA family protein [Niallia nealsonii]|uniref:Uncharacterized protein n=1 Tax=Niallia nealsonii TaxID=115979 RepID=A0A2N0YW85_9BACI|nr:hypothetical protein [Niallia nealsonii]PKG21514.1 hypothetical protein CWS01_22080 [Niallia nealsonii]